MLGAGDGNPAADAAADVPADANKNYLEQTSDENVDLSSMTDPDILRAFQKLSGGVNDAPLMFRSDDEAEKGDNNDESGSDEDESDNESHDDGDSDNEDREGRSKDNRKNKSNANEKKLSKKEMTEEQQKYVALLKQVVKRPDLVEYHDAKAADPRTLLYIRSLPNIVPVPRHWTRKRKYLQAKRGVEKKPFQLPEFIAKTGIGQLRATGAVQGLEDPSGKDTLKSKMRERVNPTLGKIDIDYHVLYDAFFKYQTKPTMNRFGELYYEGQEYEASSHVKDRVPGVLSPELRHALGMPENAPPPWLINMQRYGPPPSYPRLKIPGLNAPLPHGANWGYHPGGWGKAPVDANSNSLFGGDVLGKSTTRNDEGKKRKISHWGEIGSTASSSAATIATIGIGSKVNDKSDSSIPQHLLEKAPFMKPNANKDVAEPGRISADTNDSGIRTEATESGFATSSTVATTATLPTVADTSSFDLRKTSQPSHVENRPLFHVLEEKQTTISGSALVGSQHVYILPNRNENTNQDTNRSNAEIGLEGVEDQERNNEQIGEATEEELRAIQGISSVADEASMASNAASAKKKKKKSDFKF